VNNVTASLVIFFNSGAKLNKSFNHHNSSFEGRKAPGIKYRSGTDFTTVRHCSGFSAFGLMIQRVSQHVYTMKDDQQLALPPLDHQLNVLQESSVVCYRFV
jgi:hypothetical protein